MPAKLTTTEARQGTGPRAMFYVLIASVTLAVIAGLALGLGSIALPRELMPRERSPAAFATTTKRPQCLRATP